MPTDDRIIHGLDGLPAALERLGARRLLILTTPSRRHLPRLERALGERPRAIFDRAKVHVPKDIIDAAADARARAGADAIISLGGGSTTGLAKALRRRHELRVVAVPTTYAGSEMTSIWGETEGGRKQTGRDPRVRPDAVVHAPALLVGMPRAVALTSLLNALAHPISALSVPTLSDELRAEALAAVERLVPAIEALAFQPTPRDAPTRALQAAALAAQVLERAAMGEQHTVAHALGGRLDLPHAPLHAALLPHFTAALMRARPELAGELARASACHDLPARLHDLLRRVEAARAVQELAPDPAHNTRELLEEGLLERPWARDAWEGRRPSAHERRWLLSGCPDSTVIGPEPAQAARVVVALHGRGGDAGTIAARALELAGHARDVLIVAPQAPWRSWYPGAYTTPHAALGPALPNALAAIERTLARVFTAVRPGTPVYLYGFSQGACLALEVFARTAHPIAGVFAPAGARVGPAEEQPALTRALAGAVAVVGVADDDRWVTRADVDAAADALRDAGATVHLLHEPGDRHAESARQRLAISELLAGREPGRRHQTGFGNTHASEALPGALPRRQNTPLRPPYGLHAEQINGTGFAAPRHHNLRTWCYRIRPSALRGPFADEPLAHPTFVADWDDEQEPNLMGFDPLPLPDAPTDFVDGVATIGGAGSPSLRRGYALHVYAANRSMEQRALYNADGDLLLIPQRGRLTLLTELGALELQPGEIATLPRGLLFSVLLRDGAARGYLAEVFGRHFELPERGPVGANGLTDPRHFRAPVAWFEDRLAPGFQITAKLGGRLFTATQDHSPFDVVAWHGNYAPYVYDLGCFCPVGNTRFDHPDPSIYTVIGAPLDEQGSNSLDLVFFPPRWDNTEHTFRPPFFHRNATTEFNGIIRDPGLREDGPFREGGYFVTPSMTAHGVLARAIEREYRRRDDAGARIPDRSAWFQFETALPLHLTRWARRGEHRVPGWPQRWGVYRSRFDPSGG